MCFQQIYNALVSGSLIIAKEAESYAVLPKALAERINDKMEGFIIVNNSGSISHAFTFNKDFIFILKDPAGNL